MTSSDRYPFRLRLRRLFPAVLFGVTLLLSIAFPGCSHTVDLASVPLEAKLLHGVWKDAGISFSYPSAFSNHSETTGRLMLDVVGSGRRYRLPVIVMELDRKGPDRDLHVVRQARLGDVMCRQVVMPSSDFANIHAFTAETTLPDGKSLTVSLRAAAKQGDDALAALRLAADIAQSAYLTKSPVGGSVQ